MIAHFFMTSIFTLVISTLRLNSGGNFVFFRSLASTGVAMVAGERFETEARRVVMMGKLVDLRSSNILEAV